MINYLQYKHFTQMLHVWNIYLHLPKNGPNVGFHILYMEHLGPMHDV